MRGLRHYRTFVVWFDNVFFPDIVGEKIFFREALGNVVGIYGRACHQRGMSGNVDGNGN